MENPNEDPEDSDSSLTDSSPKRLSIAEVTEDETTYQSDKTMVLTVK